jgi:hypothetical protein
LWAVKPGGSMFDEIGGITWPMNKRWLIQVR